MGNRARNISLTWLGFSVPFHWAYLRAGSQQLAHEENLLILTDIFRAEARRSSRLAQNNLSTILLRLYDDVVTEHPDGPDMSLTSARLIAQIVASDAWSDELKAVVFKENA